MKTKISNSSDKVRTQPGISGIYRNTGISQTIIEIWPFQDNFLEKPGILSLPH